MSDQPISPDVVGGFYIRHPTNLEAVEQLVNRHNQLAVAVVEFLDHWDSYVPDRGFTLAGAVDTLRAVLREGVEE